MTENDLTRPFSEQEREELRGLRLSVRDVRDIAGHCVTSRVPGALCLQSYLESRSICTLREAIADGICAYDFVTKGDALSWRATRMVMRRNG